MADRKEAQIPYNYEDGVPFLGQIYKKRNLLEAVVFGFLIGGGLFYLSYFIILFTLQVSIYIGLIALFMIFILFANGINGDCPTRQIKHLILSKIKHRTAYYNPRIKRVDKPEIDIYDDEENVLPRDKIIAMFNKYKEKMNIETKHEIKQEDIQSEDYIFMDDIITDDSKKSLIEKIKGGILSVKEKATRRKTKDKKD